MYYDQKQAAYTEKKEFDPYWLFDAKLTYNLKRVDVYAEATNIFNINYFDILNITMPGRWFKAGLQIRLKY